MSSDELLTQGRRHLVCGEIPKAVESFQKACETLAAEYGDFDERLATPNLLYGSALLELARIESTVIGNALDGIPEQDDDSDSGDEVIEEGPILTAEEKESISNQVIDAMLEDDPSVNKSAECKSDEHAINDSSEANIDLNDNNLSTNEDKKKEIESKDEVEGSEVTHVEEVTENEADKVEEQQESDDSESKDEDGSIDGEGDEDARGNEELEGEDVAKSDDEDVTNLQIAWEVIEVARKIFSGKDDEASRLNVSECLEKLGEISREKEDYPQAISDLKESLSIRVSILGEKDRQVAESYFQLGTTYAVSGDLEQAGVSFRSSVNCLKQLADDIKIKLDQLSDNDEQKQSLSASLAEIQDLIPDVERRCAEIEEDRLTEKVETPGTVGDICTNGSNAPVDDISHLIRKKRPIHDKPTGSIPDKTNGVSETNGGAHSPTPKKAKLCSENSDIVVLPTDVNSEN